MNEIFYESIPTPLALSHPRSYKKSQKFLHVHDNAVECLLFISGNVDYFIENSIFPMRPGDMVLLPPGIIHGFLIGDDSLYERIPIHMQVSLLRSLSTPSTNLMAAFEQPHNGNRLFHLDRQEFDQFVKYSDTMIQLIEQKPFGYDIMVEAHLLMLLVLINSAYQNANYKAEDISPVIIKKAIDYISLHLTENLNVQAIADELNISCSRLSHLFKEYTGSSVWNYVVARRLLLSRSLLMEGKAVIDACYESGFRDYANFNKAFSRTFRISPGRYRKNLRSPGLE